jgi:hypothetical protein
MKESPMNPKDKIKCPSTLSLIQWPNWVPAATASRRAMLETKRSILKKLSQRLNKHDCVCS